MSMKLVNAAFGLDTIVLHRCMVRALGIKEATLLTEHMEQERLHGVQYEEYAHPIYTVKREDIENSIGYSAKVQKRVEDSLIEQGLLVREQAGMPARTYYMIWWHKVDEIFK